MQVSLLALTPSSFLFRVCLGEATDTITFLTSNIPHSFYSESLLYMPASYHVNSHSMRFKEPPAPPSGAAALAGARISAGLPESGTLFCSYNQFFKIDEGILRAWSAILARDPSSWLVLVKFMFYEYAGPRLSRMIGERGAMEGQLVLAEKKGTGEHIERSALMDLHLDTRSLIFPQFHTSARLFPFPEHFITPPEFPKSICTTLVIEFSSIQFISIQLTKIYKYPGPASGKKGGGFAFYVHLPPPSPPDAKPPPLLPRLQSGHTTTVDALWSGIPVLVWPARSMVSRAAAGKKFHSQSPLITLPHFSIPNHHSTQLFSPIAPYNLSLPLFSILYPFLIYPLSSILYPLSSILYHLSSRVAPHPSYPCRHRSRRRRPLGRRTHRGRLCGPRLAHRRARTAPQARNCW